MSDPHPHVDHREGRSSRYDAYYCADCDEWLEPRCTDPGCDYCLERPERPSQAAEL